MFYTKIFQKNPKFSNFFQNFHLLGVYNTKHTGCPRKNTLIKFLSDPSCFGSLQGDKKDMQVHNISISEQNCNDISKDLNTCGLHYPSATELRSREGEKPRPAKRVGRLWFSSTAPRLLLELDSSRIKRTTPHTRNKYEHLVR